MTSSLRVSPVFDTQSTQSRYPSASPPAKKQKMSLTQTYYIASTARTKLGREASRADHDLRVLVGHANLLDVLMVELQDAEREQEAWFNESLRKANKQSKPEQPRHVQWIDTIAEELDAASDTDSDSDDEIYEENTVVAPTSQSYQVSSREVSEDEDEDDLQDMEYDEEHALSRIDSHPPELTHEDSDDSEDESMPGSPNSSELEFTQYQPAQPIKTTPYTNKMDQQDHYLEDSIIIQQRPGPMISAY